MQGGRGGTKQTRDFQHRCTIRSSFLAEVGSNSLNEFPATLKFATVGSGKFTSIPWNDPQERHPPIPKEACHASKVTLPSLSCSVIATSFLNLILTVQNARESQEQHIPNSVNHSPYMRELFMPIVFVGNQRQDDSSQRRIRPNTEVQRVFFCMSASLRASRRGAPVFLLLGSWSPSSEKVTFAAKIWHVQMSKRHFPRSKHDKRTTN